MLRLIFIAMIAATTPARAGPALVGLIRLHIVDKARADPVATNHRREWMVRIYYPSNDARRRAKNAYADDTKLIDAMVAGGYYDVPKPELRKWATMKGPAASGLAAARTNYPLITLSPGLGVAAFNYGRLASAIARRGFIVAVVDHPYVGISRLPDGRILSSNNNPALAEEDMKKWSPLVTDWAKDLSVTLDRLQDRVSVARLAPGLRIDATHVIAVGHSLGGTIALQACADDPRILACADFEGTPEGSSASVTGPSKPTLFVSSRSGKPDRPHIPPPLDRFPYDFLAHGKSPMNWAVAVRGGSHMSFSDAPFVMPETLSHFGGTLMTAERSLALYAGMTETFAKAYSSTINSDRTLERFLRAAPEIKYSQWSGRRAPGKP